MTLIYVLACVLFAWVNKLMIGKVKIKHGLNALFHLGFAFLIYRYGDGILAGVGALFLGKAVFDTSLSLFRGLGVDYVSPEVLRYKTIWEAFKKGKVTDFIEARVFPNVVYARMAYLLIWFVLNNIR